MLTLKKKKLNYNNLWEVLILELADNTTILPDRSQLVYHIVRIYLYLTFLLISISIASPSPWYSLTTRVHLLSYCCYLYYYILHSYHILPHILSFLLIVIFSTMIQLPNFLHIRLSCEVSFDPKDIHGESCLVCYIYIYIFL